MIHVERPAQIPSGLKTSGKAQTESDRAAYDANPDAYKKGAKRFPRKSYYSAPPVKRTLVEMHLNKCCYCETKLPPEYLHVEHFRPRGGFRQDQDQKEDELPGYYWLAYCWENLLLACHACNTTFKRTLFPLANPEKRARSHHDELADEHPLFIDPVKVDPREHINFEDENPKGLTPEGCGTIEGMGLRRIKLREDRLELLGHINARLWFLKAAASCPPAPDLQTKVDEAIRFIESAIRPEAEFSSMVIDYFSGAEVQSNHLAE